MNYKRIWKISLAAVLVISVSLILPSVFKAYELPDGMIRMLGTLDIIGVFLMVFAFAKAQMKH
jgi:hypothetical protein